MVSGWRQGQEQQQQDYTHLGSLVHRSSPQAAWGEAGSQAQQALLSQFMVTSTALATKAGMHDPNNRHDASDGAAGGMTSQQQKSGRGYKASSQPSSPARTRRAGSDHAQQYGLLNSAAAYGQLAVTATGSSPRGQTSTWGRPSSARPSSNPAPSRGGAGHLSGSAQMGRSSTPGRTASSTASRGSSSASQNKFAYGYEQQQQPAQQLGDFFIATSLKVPQRYEQSPYLKSSSKPAQASTGTSGGLSSPRSPQGRSTTVASAGNSGSYSRQQLGALYSSSPDPVGRMKLGSSGTTSSKVSASQEGFKPSRGPGALVASGSRSSTPNNASSASATAQFRSSTSTRYNGGTTTASSSASSSRAATPQASLSAHKQSLHQQQQLQQMRQSQSQQPQQQQRLERQSTGGQQQQQQLLPSGSSIQQQPSQPYVSASAQFSGLLISTSSSTITGRPQTARGSSRAELRAADSTTAAGAAASGNSAAPGQAGGVNLDPQSWSTFLAMSSSSAAAEVAASNPASRSRTPSESGMKAPQQQQQRQQQQQPVVPSAVPRNLQAQMLSDLGLGGGSSGAADTAHATAPAAGSSTPQRQPSGNLISTQQQQQQSPAAPSRPQSTSGMRRSILAAGGTAANAAQQLQHGAAGPAREPSSSGTAHRSSGDECPPSPSAAAAAVPGPLHAGLMRPRSANSMLQLATQQSPIQQQQQPVAAAGIVQPSSYLQNLQQQQQQHSNSGSPVPMRMAGQPVTPLSALRRRSSAAEVTSATAAAGGANSPVGYSNGPSASGAAANSSESPMAGSPVPSYYQQPWGVRTEDGAMSSPRTTILAAQQQLLQSAGSSPVPLRRMGSSDVGNGGTSSPGLSRMQGEWGTLTAMSAFRASGYGASLAESSTELSCSSPVCNSAASWSSMGGAGPPAHLISSIAAAAAAAGAAPGTPGGALVTGGSTVAPVGPGPSPLGIGSRPSSTAGTPQHAGSTMQYQASNGGIGSFGSPSVGARRHLSFSSEGASPVPAAAAAAAGGAVSRSVPAAASQRQEQQQEAAAPAAEAVPGQQSSSATGSYPGSRSSSSSAQTAPAAAAAAGGAVPPSQQSAIQQQHQSMEQRLNQLQQMHQAYKQQLQQAARLLDAAAGNTASAAAQQQQQQQQMAAASTSAAAAGNLEGSTTAAATAAPAAAAGVPASRRESCSAADSKAQNVASSSVAATGGWTIPAAQQQQQQAQQAIRPSSRSSQAQPDQQQQQQKRESASGATAAPAVPAASPARASSAAQPAAQAAAAAAPAQTAARPTSAIPTATATTAASAAAPAAASAPASTAATTAAAAPAAAGSAAAAAAPAAAADAGSEPLLLPGYSVGAVVGEGGFCQVRLAVHHLSRRRVAVKVIDKTKLSDAAEARRMQREIRVLKRLNHPCVIRLFEVLEAGQKLLLVMEYAPGGSLLDYVRGRKRLGEAEAAHFLQQILTGLQYCHDSEVVHRDIKLENILLDSNRAMKLIDFGLAAFYAPGKKLRVHCGSPSYAAPEIVARKMYEGPPVDVWSLGVVLFAMLAGFLPFHSPTGNKQELCQKIMAGTFNTPDWLSPGARDLLGRMLTVDPEARITLADAIQHPWTRSSGIVWELPSTHCYSLPSRHGGCSSIRSSNSSGDGEQQGSAVPSIPTEGIEAQASILEELEGHGYSRPAVVRYLAASECNYITASYYLLAEARQEAAQKALPQKPWPFQPVAVSSRSSGSSRSRAANSSAAGTARPASGTGVATGTSRPASGVPAGAGGGYVSSRPATAVAVTS